MLHIQSIMLVQHFLPKAVKSITDVILKMQHMDLRIVRSELLFKAIYDGERDFSKIAIVGGMEGTDGNDTCAPCGICRQVMMEFCSPETFKVILANGTETPLEYSLKELLPLGFGPSNLSH